MASWSSTSMLRPSPLALVALLIPAVSLADPAGEPEEKAPPPPASVCFGGVADGALRGGWRLPYEGTNYRAFGRPPWEAGRTFVHSTVHGIVLEAYARLGETLPEHRFLYAETGLEQGGPIRLHRTHRNGLSVDFMVPMRDARGAPTVLPGNEGNLWGYRLELDAQGRLGPLRIDFEAMAQHLLALHEAAAHHGVRIAKIVFDPYLRSRHLAQAPTWPKVRHLPFTRHPVATRHDDHYHVDFAVPCLPTPPEPARGRR